MSLNWLQDLLQEDITPFYEEVDTPTARLHRKFAIADLEIASYDDEDYDFVSEEEANLITSKVDDDLHAPVLDIDVPHRLLPSSTDGHSHLYIDISCSWSDYVEFLEAAERIGLLESGYVNASIKREFTAVRKEGIYKTEEEKLKDTLKRQKGIY